MTDSEFAPVSTLAVMALLSGITGTVAFLFIPFIAAGVLAVPIAIAARRGIAKYELSGLRLVVIGMNLAVLTIPFAPAWHLRQYRSEALPDHDRLDFASLSDKFVSLSAESRNSLDQYHNQRICLKGYALALPNREERTFFLLSPDGDYRNEKNAITVMVPDGWEYSYHPIAVSGILLVNQKADGAASRYRFSASAIRRANTSYGLAPRVPGDC